MLATDIPQAAANNNDTLRDMEETRTESDEINAPRVEFAFISALTAIFSLISSNLYTPFSH